MNGIIISPSDIGRKFVCEGGRRYQIVGIVDRDFLIKSDEYPNSDASRYRLVGHELLIRGNNDYINVGFYFGSWIEEPATKPKPRPKDLRDEFAMVAMQSLILTNPTSSSEFSGDIWENPNGRGVHEWMSSTAYAIADAMMKAREAK